MSPIGSLQLALAFWDNHGTYVDTCPDRRGARWSHSPAMVGLKGLLGKIIKKMNAVKKSVKRAKRALMRTLRH